EVYKSFKESYEKAISESHWKNIFELLRKKEDRKKGFIKAMQRLIADGIHIIADFVNFIITKPYGIIIRNIQGIIAPFINLLEQLRAIYNFRESKTPELKTSLIGKGLRKSLTLLKSSANLIISFL